MTHPLGCLGRKSKSWCRLSLVEDGKDGLEEDVTEDGEANAGVRLDATEASGSADW